jgi:S1-C subfamily serine protease
MWNEREAGPSEGGPQAAQVPARTTPAVPVPAAWGAAPPPPPQLPPGPPGQPPLPPAPPRYLPPAGPPSGPPSRRNRSSRFVAALVVGLVASIGVGIGLHDATSSSSPSAGFAAEQLRSRSQSLGSSSNADVSAIADKVDPAIVNITTTLSSGGEAAGTGMVISSDGLVLTNNHVIADSTSIEATIGGTGSAHSAKVLGYDVADDIAVVKIDGVSGLQTISTGDSSSLSVGDDVVAIGNALGRGGTPTATGGTVTALNQTITASDEGGGNAETLHGLIQVDAGIQPGDSGGPLVDADGQVVGMDTAASTGGGGFGFDRVASNEGYAIPIEHAASIAEKIVSGDGGTNIHIGSGRALLGVSVGDTGQSSGNGFGGRGGFNGGNGFDDPFGNGSGNFGNGSSSAGVAVQGVQPGSAADSAGIQTGDSITAVDGQSVSTGSDVKDAVNQFAPHDHVRIDWTDSSGNAHHATVELGSGPPA